MFREMRKINLVATLYAINHIIASRLHTDSNLQTMASVANKSLMKLHVMWLNHGQ
jgi:hypothetical protein